MNYKTAGAALMLLWTGIPLSAADKTQEVKGGPMSVYEFHAKTIAGADQSLADYHGKVLLIVNVASRCGFTPQYKGLEELYEKYKGQGFEVLGFPCNQFGHQEPGTEAEIKTFCDTSFHVKFPLFSKIDVNGPDTHPLYVFLKSSQKGFLGTKDIKWNFTKFLIDRQGHPVARYASATKPEDIEKDVKAQIAK